MRDAIAVFNHGVHHLSNSDYGHAVEVFTEAIELDSTLARAYNGRGAVYALISDIDKGIADCTEGIRLDPRKAVSIVCAASSSERLATRLRPKRASPKPTNSGTFTNDPTPAASAVAA